jgi:hypothetical protein
LRFTDAARLAATSGAIQLNLLYIHGVKNDAGSRSSAQHSLDDLKAAVTSDLPSLVASYQATDRGIDLLPAISSDPSAFNTSHLDWLTSPNGSHAQRQRAAQRRGLGYGAR